MKLRQPIGVSLVINFTMATLILVLAFALLFTDLLNDPQDRIQVQGTGRIVLAIIFFLYSGFRYMRGWQLLKRDQRERERAKWEKTRHRKM